MTTIHLPNIQLLTTEEVREEVEKKFGVQEVSDACAATIASWYIAPTATGAVLASFATGCPVDKDVLYRDYQDTLKEHWDRADEFEEKCLSMLGSWIVAVGRPGRRSAWATA